MLLTINLIPQIIKTKKSESAKDISLSFLILNEIGLLFYTIYGLSEKLLPMALPSFLSLNLNTILLFFKIKYDYTTNQESQQVSEHISSII